MMTSNGQVEGRPTAGVTHLRPQDRSLVGKLWVMPEACAEMLEVIAPAAWPGPRSGRGAEEMVKDLKAKVCPNHEVRFVEVTTEGRVEVRGV